MISIRLVIHCARQPTPIYVLLVALAEGAQQFEASEAVPHAAGPPQRSAAVPVPLRSSQSRSVLMQGWRSIMQGSLQQLAGKSLSAAAAQKSGLDLAWRLNGARTPLS